MRNALTIALLLLAVTPAEAQMTAPGLNAARPQSQPPKLDLDDSRETVPPAQAAHQSSEPFVIPVILSVSVLAFTFAVIAVVAWMRVRKAISGDAAFKLIGVALIIGLGLFLIPAGYGQAQITPVVGLLGTALGFIFGKQMSNEPPQGDRKPVVPTEP
jgi:hypothetical protein